jgi:hypothetical protein
MAVKSRAELIAQNTATFGNGKNTRGDDEKAFNLNHLDSFLNKKGDTLEANGYVAVQDGSQLKEGTNGGIALECIVGYDFQWKEGVAYFRPTNLGIVYAMSAVDQVPNSGFDSTLFYQVGSRFINLVTNVQYICTDASVGAAVWSVVGSGGGNVTGPGPTVISNNFAVYSGTGGLTIGSPIGAELDGSGNASFLSVRVTGTGGAGHMHFRHQSSQPSGTLTSNTIYGLSNASSGFGFIINNAAYASSLIFGATSAQSYTLPDLTGTVALATAINAWGSGIKQTFAPSATTAGINVGSVSGDVSTPANGDLWYDSTGNLLRARINGATVSLGAGGGISALSAIGASPNANGATITGGTTLNLQPASASFGGVVTTDAQTFAGIKNFAATNTVFTTTTPTQDGIVILPRAGGSASLRVFITTAALVTTRTHTIPDGGANASFVMTKGSQTIDGTTTFSTAANFTNTTNSLNINSGGVAGVITFGGTSAQISWANTVGHPSLVYNFFNGVGYSNVFNLYSDTGSLGSLDIRMGFGITTATAKFHIKDQKASARPSIPMLIVDGGSLNQVAIGAEGRFMFFNTNYVRTFLTGGTPQTIAAQREIYITAPSYTGTGAAVTFTNSATFTISGAPTMVPLAVATNTPSALWIESGQSRFDGNVLIGGVTAAVARLTLAAGTATAGTAPLAFTSGTNLTTPVNGVMEYNGTNLFFTRTGAAREGVLTQSAVTTEILIADTSVTVNINGTTYKLLAKA